MLKNNIFLMVRRNKQNSFQALEMKRNVTLNLLKYIPLLWVFIFASTPHVFGQNQGNKNSPDMSLRSSGRVNPSTLAMEVDIPLGAYPGRGIDVPIKLSYSSKLWRLQYGGEHPAPGTSNPANCKAHYGARFSEESAAGWTTSMAAPYIDYTGAQNLYSYDGQPDSGSSGDCATGDGQTPPAGYFIKRITVHLPGGETHELRMEDSASLDDYSNPASWNGVYYAVDGSNLRYIQDSATGTYRLQMTDGSFYDFAQNLQTTYRRRAVKFTDRSGNFTNYYAPGSVDENGATHPNGYWKDTLGRNISVPIGLTAPISPTTAQAPQVYSLPGMTGTYKLHWKRLNGGTQAESALTDIGNPAYQLRYIGNIYHCTQNNISTYCTYPQGRYLFSGEDARIFAVQLFNPVVLSEIELPTGQKYKFAYDVYGRIEKIIYPTGGEELFEYGLVIPLTKTEETDLNYKTNFGVKKRRVYQTAGHETPYEWMYESFYTDPNGYAVRITNPDKTKSERFLHQGKSGAAADTAYFGYDSVLAGMPFEERGFDSAGNLVSRKLTSWTKNVYQVSPGARTIAERHPRVKLEKSFAYDSSGNGVSATVIYEYESESNLTKETPVLLKRTTQYAFETTTGGNSIELSSSPCDPDDELCLPPAPTSTPTPTPVPASSSPIIKIVENKFLIGDPAYSTTKSYYTAQNINGLITATIVRDGAETIVSRSEMKYDEIDAYPIISAGTTTNWQDPNNAYRGYPTTSRVWDSTKGGADNPNAYIATHAQFDNFGNQRKAWDAKGSLTETDYTSPSGQDYKFAFPTKVISAVPDPTPSQNHDAQPHGSNTAFISTATFDVVTGLPLTTTDANGLETRFEYDPVTLRPLKTKTFYQNNQFGGMTETVYHDEPGNYWVKSRALIDNNKWVESYTYFDGLGRAYKAEEVNSQGNIYVFKEFDSDGRVRRVSNPYRLSGDPCYQNNQIVCWTTNVYDEASRVKEVILQDGAKVKTDYGVSVSGTIGLTKQIVDQAGKKRKGITDALGRMIRVTEDPDGQNLNTDYVFDTLGNLRMTIQGEQSRYFTFDSLGRLLYAKQPEQEINTAFVYTDSITNHSQWSVKYEYDDNGSITKTTDANGVYVEAIYDNLNRLKFRNYSDSTPDVNFYYDGTGLGAVPDFSKGKLSKVASSVSETRYTSFDVLGRLLTGEQRTPFGTETAEQATPQTFNYQYNLTALVSEIYPSGRIVDYEYDQDGDLARVGGRAAADNGCTINCQRLYANSFTYNSTGAVQTMRLGNGKWENAVYNTRQQVTQIGLGNSASDTSLLQINYDYGTNTQNNGSLREQRISFSGLSSEIKQSYIYDDLNRLKSATETYNNGTQSWKQTFKYDRFGNRTFDAPNTTTLSQSLNWKATNPAIRTSDNRIMEDQDNDNVNEYDYDKNGSVTLDADNQRFIYDAENRLKEFFKGTNSTETSDGKYYYDGNGHRVKKITADEIVVFIYNASGTLIAESSTEFPEQAKVSYLTADHLGSPRIVTDAKGAVVARHDYLAFGDEVTDTLGNVAGRTAQQGYGAADEIRKQYTGYERDEESGLDYAQARYFNPAHGRFTSIDPLTASANVKDPQTFNRYSYALNSPYKFTDPLGLISENAGSACGNRCRNSDGASGPTEFDDNSHKVWRLPERFEPAKPEPPPASSAEQNAESIETIESIEDDPVEDAGNQTVNVVWENIEGVAQISSAMATFLGNAAQELQNMNDQIGEQYAGIEEARRDLCLTEGCGSKISIQSNGKILVTVTNKDGESFSLGGAAGITAEASITKNAAQSNLFDLVNSYNTAVQERNDRYSALKTEFQNNKSFNGSSLIIKSASYSDGRKGRVNIKKLGRKIDRKFLGNLFTSRVGALIGGN